MTKDFTGDDLGLRAALATSPTCKLGTVGIDGLIVSTKANSVSQTDA